ncbi:hypothetical protein RJ639_025361 [Escallonia herrerae]|uniref:AP-5 complex subunit zeta-1 ARM repeats domain-containing protein n=1 Tax=Escallonia herrerae TaxID=1293975 RepID=A0AA88RUG5_9ASTE|nr:hypothetical protein RJ639_025361 [Escallonia herrerae]
MVDRDKEWEFYLRSLSSIARDSNDPASDPSLLHSVKKLHELCKSEKSENLIARVYPQLNKIFQRSVASISQSQSSNGLLLLMCASRTALLTLSSVYYKQAILQFFLDYGDVVLHDADPSLRAFFRSCLSRMAEKDLGACLGVLNSNGLFKWLFVGFWLFMFLYSRVLVLKWLGKSSLCEFADHVVAEATLDFLNVNKRKLSTSFSMLLPQFFPLLLKLIAWNGEKSSFGSSAAMAAEARYFLEVFKFKSILSQKLQSCLALSCHHVLYLKNSGDTNCQLES